MKSYYLAGLLAISLMFSSVIGDFTVPHSPIKKIHALSNTPNPTQTEINCLAANVYHEAAGEPREGKIAVAMVTLNRVKSKHYPKTVCGVVYQKAKNVCQFSWACGNNHKFNKKAFDESVKIAKAAYFKKLADITHGSVMFHNTSITPSWAISKVPDAVIGNHLFYKDVNV